MPSRFQPYAIIPVLVTLTAFVLSLLTVFAGSKPGFISDYSILTLNTSRIGQNAIEKIDDTIMSINVTKIISKRGIPASISAAPTTTIPSVPSITLAPRDFLDDLTDDIQSLTTVAGSKASSVASAVKSQASSAASAVESKASSIEGLVASKIQSAVHSAQTSIVETIQNTYLDVIEELDLEDFYSLYLRNTCSGGYVMPNGTNITIGESPLPPKGTYKKIEQCEQQSWLNPLVLVRILYYINLTFTGLGLLAGLLGVFRASRKVAILNIGLLVAALSAAALASITIHGLAVAGAGVLNFLGKALGVSAQAGHKLIALSWAVTILVLIDVGLWVILLFFSEKLPVPTRWRKEKVAVNEHEMRIPGALANQDLSRML